MRPSPCSRKGRGRARTCCRGRSCGRSRCGSSSATFRATGRFRARPSICCRTRVRGGCRRRRRCATTATSSSRCRSSGAGSRSGRGGRRDAAPGDGGGCAARRGRARRRRPYGRQGPWAGWRARPRFEPGSDVCVRATILAEGTAGHLTDAALARFELAGPHPQAWALGVKEVWRCRDRFAANHPHARLAAAIGRRAAPSSAARSSIRWATSLVSIGMVVGLDYAWTPSCRCTTCCSR